MHNAILPLHCQPKQNRPSIMCPQMDKQRTNVISFSGQTVSGVGIMTAGRKYKYMPHSQTVRLLHYFSKRALG